LDHPKIIGVNISPVINVLPTGLAKEWLSGLVHCGFSSPNDPRPVETLTNLRFFLAFVLKDGVPAASDVQADISHKIPPNYLITNRERLL